MSFGGVRTWIGLSGVQFWRIGWICGGGGLLNVRRSRGRGPFGPFMAPSWPFSKGVKVPFPVLPDLTSAPFWMSLERIAVSGPFGDGCKSW